MELGVSSIDEIVAANEHYATEFAQSKKGSLPIPPARKLVVITCMDARIDPAASLGLSEGDAHVIRNAGGRASGDALRSLVISQQLLGTEEVAVIHHTDCGMLTFTNDRLRQICRDEFGREPSDVDFLPFSDLEQSVRDDVEAVRTFPFVRSDTRVSGFVYDVRTGRLSEVADAGSDRLRKVA
jgi:carbonic anhydrase